MASCSFCGKRRHEVRALIPGLGSGVYICAKCVYECMATLERECPDRVTIYHDCRREPEPDPDGPDAA
jgi:ATP-dependent protease Clp ATPase subunit